MTWLLTVVRWLLLLLALAGVVVTVLPDMNGDTWWIRGLDFPRLEFLIAMAVVGLLLALLPRRTWLSWVAVVAMIGTCAYDAYLLAPFSTVVGPQEVTASSCPDGSRLRLLEVNVEMTNKQDEKLLDIVQKANPDVAWFQETNGRWEKDLAPLSKIMPYGVAKAQPNYFGVHLFSKLPLSELAGQLPDRLAKPLRVHRRAPAVRADGEAVCHPPPAAAGRAEHGGAQCAVAGDGTCRTR